MRSRWILLLAFALACATVPGRAQSTAQPFAEWLAELLVEARERGYDDELLARTLGEVEPLPGVLASDRAQPEVKLTFHEYVRRRVTRDTVRRGREHLATHRDLLRRVSDGYGVPPRVVVAIWGLESRFGERTGEVPVFAALATLAWDGRRGAFFRSQLYDALTIVDRGYIDASSLKGSWAGAMGQPQFLPSSYLGYAVDFDGDGRRDVWTSYADTFASIANYLMHHGWRGDDWGREVRATPAVLRQIAETVGTRPSGCRAMREMTIARPLREWRDLGLTQTNGGPLPSAGTLARLVRAGTRQFLVHETYDALLHYNCAHYYALAVALLADQLR